MVTMFDQMRRARRTGHLGEYIKDESLAARIWNLHRRDHPVSWLWMNMPWLTRFQSWMLSASSVSISISIATLKYTAKQEDRVQVSLEQMEAQGLEPPLFY